MAGLPEFYDQAFEVFNADGVYLYVQEMLSEYPGLAKNSEFQALRSQIVEGLILQIKSWCVSGRIQDVTQTHKVRFPDGVWQMFKERYAPHWFSRRFPVRMRTVEVTETLNIYFVCPHLVTDPQSRHVQFMATGTRVARQIRSYP